MANFNFNIQGADFKLDLIDQIDTDCATIFNYRVSATDNDVISISLGQNADNSSYSLNGVVSTFSGTSSVTFDSSLFISFSVQNSGIPGVFNSVDMILNNTTASKIISSSVVRNSDSPRCENLEYTFDGLTDTPDDKDGQAGLFLKVSDDETKIEFVDIQNSVIFNSDLDDNLAMPYDVGGIPAGTTIGELNALGLNLTDYVVLQNFETVIAYVYDAANTTLSGQNTTTNEVGTAITQSINVGLDEGIIRNGDQTVAGPVVGAISIINIKSPSNSIVFTTNTPTDPTNAILPAYTISQGTNTWTVEVNNLAGVTTYQDNKGGTETVSSIESAKADTTRDNVTFSMTGLYKRFHYVGTEGNSPTTSTAIRALDTAFLSTSNTGTWIVTIPAGSSSAEFSFYVPTGGSFTVIDLGNLNLDITSDFSNTSITVNDAGGAGVNYTKYTRFAGTLGYTNPTTFQITVL